jgi:hypothetical protein
MPKSLEMKVQVPCGIYPEGSRTVFCKSLRQHLSEMFRKLAEQESR